MNPLKRITRAKMLSDTVNRQVHPECISSAVCLAVPSLLHICAVRILFRFFYLIYTEIMVINPHAHRYMLIHVLLGLLGSQVL